MDKRIPERPEPEHMQHKKPILQQWPATIIDFYEADGDQIDVIKSESNIFDIIYADDGGVHDRMCKARSSFHEMISTGPNNMTDEENPLLRWIHLPANIVCLFPNL